MMEFLRFQNGQGPEGGFDHYASQALEGLIVPDLRFLPRRSDPVYTKEQILPQIGFFSPPARLAERVRRGGGYLVHDEHGPVAFAGFEPFSPEYAFEGTDYPLKERTAVVLCAHVRPDVRNRKIVDDRSAFEWLFDEVVKGVRTQGYDDLIGFAVPHEAVRRRYEKRGGEFVGGVIRTMEGVEVPFSLMRFPQLSEEK